jgi:hypothetical protein
MTWIRISRAAAFYCHFQCFVSKLRLGAEKQRVCDGIRVSNVACAAFLRGHAAPPCVIDDLTRMLVFARRPKSAHIANNRACVRHVKLLLY